ncbi:MAG TPA: selenocysteine-specific translation elongation factor [Mycobacteriales bacterium]|nr:selenocysteine-specific translation elongation factor [Mycobacteriales bacterium]
MHVVATAGHVDHGKSTLVRALTGMEPDRWAEERRRGMTIDLGYAWTRLPSDREVAFVDVPGHQRFIGNMLAGVGPVPAALFVVAADEGWQRQSAEHLAALDALGVRHGVLAVTRSDLADPAAATEEALDRIGRTSLGRVRSVAVSAVTGAGVGLLRDALDMLLAELPQPDVDARVRLWVDRSFTIRGAGTVVTGTLPAGRLAVGDELTLASSGDLVRVRAIESLKRRIVEAHAVARVAVNLRGVELVDVGRGDALLTPGRWRTTSAVDVRVRGAAVGDLPRELVLHLGSAGVPVRLRRLGDDVARLALHTPLPVQAGDRALLRDPGRQSVAAGVVVLDADPPELVRRGAAQLRAVALASSTGVADVAAEVRRRGAVRRTELVALGVIGPGAAVSPGAGDDAVVAPGVRELHGWLVEESLWSRWQEALLRTVDEHHAARPLDAGVAPAAAERAVGVPDRVLLSALVGDTPAIEMAAGRLRRRAARVALPAGVAEVRTRLDRDPFDAPDQPELDRLALTTPVLAAAGRAGVLLVLGGGVVLHPAAGDRAAELLRAIPQPFGPADARAALGVPRRVVIPLLEHLDRIGVTRRDGSVRHLR